MAGSQTISVSHSPKANECQNQNKESASPAKPGDNDVSSNQMQIDSTFTDCYDWTALLKQGIRGASVDMFNHVPLAKVWKTICPVGLKVEVAVDDKHYKNAHWVATVVELSGYKVRLRFLGIENTSEMDVWLHICSKNLKPITYCSRNNYPLVPPSGVRKFGEDLRKYIIEQLDGSVSLHQEMSSLVEESFKSKKLQIGNLLECVDMDNLSMMRLGTVEKVVGDRVYVRYLNGEATNDEKGLWCHQESSLIHPPGWCRVVGHNISAPFGYQPQLLKIIDEVQAKIELGMKFECINPWELCKIVPATVVKVLRHGYFMARSDVNEPDASSEKNWCSFHISSALIFPCGFCNENGIGMSPPWNARKNDHFDWPTYLKDTESSPLPIIRKKNSVGVHRFKVGMKLEAVDLVEPDLIAVATIVQVADGDGLIKIHFDGWSEEYDQWHHCQSLDLYPIGYCELIGYKLEDPGHLFT